MKQSLSILEFAYGQLEDLRREKVDLTLLPETYSHSFC